jgi:hypothetical protein
MPSSFYTLTCKGIELRYEENPERAKTLKNIYPNQPHNLLYQVGRIRSHFHFSSVGISIIITLDLVNLSLIPFLVGVIISLALLVPNILHKS